MKKDGFLPDRDIILALTADEEGGKSNGVDWLLKNHRDLAEAEFVLNPDGGGIRTDQGKPIMMSVDATEKVYADYQLLVTNRGGHSSLPIPDNAIYHLAEGLAKLAHYQFPFEFNNVTRAYYERMSQTTSGQRADDMKAILRTPPDQAAIARLSEDAKDNSTLHTTCVATRTSSWRISSEECPGRIRQFTLACARCGRALLACPASRRVATQVVCNVELSFASSDSRAIAAWSGGVCKIAFLSSARCPVVVCDILS